MKREILFKAKRIDNGEWVYGSLVIEIRGVCIISFNSVKYTVKSETVCQFTGLLDKNGNKIFEGDVCNVFNWGVKNNDLLFVSNVVYDADELGWNFEKSIIEDRYDLRKAFNKCEIISNIYDND